MSAIKVYGVPMSRTWRVLWLCEELGIDYQNIPVNPYSGAKTPEYLALNPNGKVPTLDDNGFVLWESLAINNYLVKKHQSALSPSNLQEEGLFLQWSFWALGEIEIKLVEAVTAAEKDKNSAETKTLWASLAKPLDILNNHLGKHSYVVGDRFTVVDINLSALIGFSRMGEFDLSAWTPLEPWLHKCLN